MKRHRLAWLSWGAGEDLGGGINQALRNLAWRGFAAVVICSLHIERACYALMASQI